ncbi:MAG: energy transducer TonB [Alloprevotella sp.]
MSKVDLISRQWCDLVFEGRNKEYGAYRMRANAGKRQLRAIILVIIGILVIGAVIAIKSAVEAAINANRDLDAEMATELSQLKKEEPKKEEKKVEVHQEEKPEMQKVAVKASIAFTVPDIVDQVDETKKLKTQDEVTRSNISIASQDYAGDSKDGINIDDLKDNQTAGGTQAPPKEEEILENVVEQPAQFPGGEGALINYVNSHVKYPQIAIDQDLQGVVLLRFVVEKNGSVGDVIVKKSLSKECDAAAIKVVKSLPKFIPAKSQGHPVRVWFTLPVRFQIQ